MPTTIQFPSGSHVEVTAAPNCAPSSVASCPLCVPVFDPTRTLCVAVAYSNPQRWRSRLALFRDFREYMATLPNVRLFVGELVYGNDPFQVTTGQSDELQLRAPQILWHKENILNLVIRHKFPTSWMCGAYCDADFHFSRRDIAEAAILKLHKAGWVQLFSSYSNLSSRHELMGTMEGFAKRRKKTPVPSYGSDSGYEDVGACGGAWAFTRDAFEGVGGLIDFCITGSADWHMAFGMTVRADFHPEMKSCCSPYRDLIRNWQSKSFDNNKGLDNLDCHALHYWHGPLSSRGYGTRWHVLRDNKFDPAHDLYRLDNGVLQVSAAKQAIADGILKYFASRNEDADE